MLGGGMEGVRGVRIRVRVSVRLPHSPSSHTLLLPSATLCYSTYTPHSPFCVRSRPRPQRIHPRDPHAPQCIDQRDSHARPPNTRSRPIHALARRGRSRACAGHSRPRRVGTHAPSRLNGSLGSIRACTCTSRADPVTRAVPSANAGTHHANANAVEGPIP